MFFLKVVDILILLEFSQIDAWLSYLFVVQYSKLVSYRTIQSVTYNHCWQEHIYLNFFKYMNWSTPNVLYHDFFHDTCKVEFLILIYITIFFHDTYKMEFVIWIHEFIFTHIADIFRIVIYFRNHLTRTIDPFCIYMSTWKCHVIVVQICMV